MIQKALEIEEDIYWSALAEERLKNPQTISEEKFWKQVFSS
jgi:hypothetical protein